MHVLEVLLNVSVLDVFGVRVKARWRLELCWLNPKS